MSSTPAIPMPPPVVGPSPAQLTPAPPPRSIGALTKWAFGLAVGAVVAMGSVVVSLSAAQPGIRSGAHGLGEAMVAVLALALSTFVVGIVATVRGERRGERTWPAVSAIVIAPVVTTVWLFVALVLAITASINGTPVW